MQTKFYHPDITAPDSLHLTLSVPFSISFLPRHYAIHVILYFLAFVQPDNSSVLRQV